MVEKTTVWLAKSPSPSAATACAYEDTAVGPAKAINIEIMASPLNPRKAPSVIPIKGKIINLLATVKTNDLSTSFNF